MYVILMSQCPVKANDDILSSSLSHTPCLLILMSVWQ